MDKKGQVKVTFVDYGNTDTVKLSELRRDIIYADIPCLCYKSVLHNVCPFTKDGKWELKLLDFLHKTVVEKLCRVTIMEEPVMNEPLQIKLEIIEPELDVATMLVNKMKVCYFTNTNVDEQSSVDVVVEGESQDGESTKSASTSELPLPALPTLTPPAPLTLSLPPPAPLTLSLPPPPLPPPHTLLPDNLSEKFAVKVTAIKDPACVYISPVASDLLPTSPYQSFLTSHHQCYTQFIKHINSNIQEFPLSKNLVVGKLYLGKFITGCWYRVKVLSLTPTTSSVLYVDFGNLEIISRHCLRECPSEGKKLPLCAVCVQLHQVQPPHGQEQSWSEESMKAMINCLMGPQGHFLATIIDPGDPMQVALYTINSTAGNSILAYAEVAAKVTPEFEVVQTRDGADGAIAGCRRQQQRAVVVVVSCRHRHRTMWWCMWQEEGRGVEGPEEGAAEEEGSHHHHHHEDNNNNNNTAP
ncbi:hypothetical protein Pcinc_039756 [Petrolisthes cinctipes]|uniref:Tudor domain-containing protein n=1 Tax=Petrolisthes cinctipes TaxID=88211 RepID=A0AAE1BR20_PETCI|nr:hypothetical protein Pcinc_039756 [Petrolisthes cinctipes]